MSRLRRWLCSSIRAGDPIPQLAPTPPTRPSPTQPSIRDRGSAPRPVEAPYRPPKDRQPYLPDGTPNPAWPGTYREIAEDARRIAERAHKRGSR